MTDMSEIPDKHDGEEMPPPPEIDSQPSTIIQSAEPPPMSFRRSHLSYFTLFFLVILWPASSILFVGDPTEALKLLSLSPIYFIYLPTIVIQWLIFALIFLTTFREQTGLGDIGFKKIRIIDFLWAIAFLLGSNLILSLLAVLLKSINLEIPGEIELILPKTFAEQILWVFLSLTAGICEEAAFRGYLITRIKIIGKTKNWILPIIIASLSFGSGHAYQGVGGFILISIYGAMFALLFLRTKTLWPCIIAHFFQDFSALFYPYQR
jgi:membrane protease YdiL (CAAX protease family)